MVGTLEVVIRELLRDDQLANSGPGESQWREILFIETNPS